MNVHTWRPSGRVPITPRGLRPAKRFPILTLVASLLLLMGVAGCGDEEANSAKSGHKDTGSASGTLSPQASPDAANNAAKPDPGALGIDTVQWPGEHKGAKALFDRMPDRLAGKPMKGPQFSGGPYAGVSYGPPNKGGIVAWVMGTDKEVKEPEAALAVMFGMQLACKKGTYVGTATKSPWGTPDIDRKQASVPEDGLWWFSCAFEGEPVTYTGHAIGWVSGDLAWLVTTPDKVTTKATLAAMKSARTAP